ncbi:MAG: hypothetical protein EOM07_00760 [Clostridia bacterium]|nr:hypothetical protein [Clostridia bacterium]
MDKRRKPWFYLILVIITLSLVIAGCTTQSEDKDNTDQKWDYRPMISRENFVYGDTGKIEQTLPEGFMYIGKTERRVSQTAPMVKGRTYFVSNSLPVETNLYGFERSEEIIYADINGSFMLYELIEK